jgi:hypothetical protein
MCPGFVARIEKPGKFAVGSDRKFDRFAISGIPPTR